MTGRICLAIVGLLTLLVSAAEAVEVTNVRVTTGPMGAVRTQTKFLPGDGLYICFDIDNLKVDPKLGMATYQATLEILDANDKQIFSQDAPPKSIDLYGGTRLPADAHAILGGDQTPGKYKIKVTVNDKVAKQNTAFVYSFELLEPGFGLVRPGGAVIGFVGQEYVFSFAVVGMQRNDKKLPDVELTLQLYDKAEKPLYTNANVLQLKDVVTPDPLLDITTAKSVPMIFSLYLNRPGQFAIVLEANDKLAKQKRTLRFPLTVLDASTYTGK